MTPSFGDSDLESDVKVETERFEDEIIKEPKLQLSKCEVYVFDVLLPVVKLHPLDEKTIERWTKPKCRDSEQPTRSSIQKTIKKIRGDRFSCDLCLNWFPAKSSIKKHMYCHLSTVKKTEFKKGKKCPYCFKKVARTIFSSHVIYHESLLTKRTCPTCGLKITRHHLKRHMMTHEQFRCRECKKILKSQLELKEHMSRVHYGGKGHECFCGKIYKTKLNLRSHQSGVHVKRKNYCEICGEEFESNMQKFRHWRAQHAKKHGNHGQWKRQNGSVRMVLKNGGPFICDLCGKIFRARHLICEHFKQHHGPKKIFSCDICGKIYKFKHAIAAHMKASHMTETYDCDICGKKFSFKNYIRQHMGIHNKESKCKICHKKVKNMKSHIGSIHIYENKKACAICGVMIYKQYMKNHINARHIEKPKPFQCKKCDEAFQYKFMLFKHNQQEHHAKTLKRPSGHSIKRSSKSRVQKKLYAKTTFSCSDCSAKYKTEGSLKLHRRNVHLKFLGRKKFKPSKKM